MSAPIVRLPASAPDRLAAALQAVLRQAKPAGGSALPTVDSLRQGAEQTLRAETKDSKAAGAFQSLLELGYIVASADGLADSEREALAKLLELATGSAIDHDTMTLHFRDLDASVEMLGRRERLRRVTAGLADLAATNEAVGFAALVALADGELGAPEMQALLELGDGLGLPAADVRSVVDDVVARVRKELR